MVTRDSLRLGMAGAAALFSFLGAIPTAALIHGTTDSATSALVGLAAFSFCLALACTARATRDADPTGTAVIVAVVFVIPLAWVLSR